MITSLVGSLLSYFGAVTLPTNDITTDANAEEGLKLVHNVAQFAHCLAQGKVGSGFDVSSATYGSHVYRRFSPEVIKEALSKAGDPLDATEGLSAQALYDIVDPKPQTSR
jgi:phosphomevalonate kinase